MRDATIFILAITPMLGINLFYYMIDPTIQYLYPVIFASLIPSTYIVYKLVAKQYEEQKVKSVK